MDGEKEKKISIIHKIESTLVLPGETKLPPKIEGKQMADEELLKVETDIRLKTELKKRIEEGRI